MKHKYYLITGKTPAENETVWFWCPINESNIHCAIYDRTGYDLGWWSGTRWHSILTKKTYNNDEVNAWAPLRLPEIAR